METFLSCWCGLFLRLDGSGSTPHAGVVCAQTFGAFLRCFGLALLNHKMYTSRSAKGVSLKTLELYALVFFFRLLSIMRHQGYLPFDKYGPRSLAQSCCCCLRTEDAFSFSPSLAGPETGSTMRWKCSGCCSPPQPSS